MTDSPAVERQRKDAKSVKGITLRDGEEILIEAVISNAIFWKSLAVVVLAVLIGILAWQLGVFLLIVAAHHSPKSISPIPSWSAMSKSSFARASTSSMFFPSLIFLYPLINSLRKIVPSPFSSH